MYSIKTANEAYESARYYEKQNKARQLISIAKDIDDAVQRGSCRISSYPPYYLYKETIDMLESLGYAVETNDAGYADISWEKG